jgi:phage tail-like protein
VRGLIEGLASPHPLEPTLPPMLRGDDFLERFTDALDDVLAPALCALDNLPAYLDPELAPPDFLAWLGSWLGMALDDDWPLDRRRTMVAHAAALYERRGTVAGLADLVALYTGARPEIVEGGGVSWSATPGGSLPGTAAPTVVVRARFAGDPPTDADLASIDALVAAAKPAHLRHTVEVLP